MTPLPARGGCDRWAQVLQHLLRKEVAKPLGRVEQRQKGVVVVVVVIGSGAAPVALRRGWRREGRGVGGGGADPTHGAHTSSVLRSGQASARWSAGGDVAPSKNFRSVRTQEIEKALLEVGNKGCRPNYSHRESIPRSKRERPLPPPPEGTTVIIATSLISFGASEINEDRRSLRQPRVVGAPAHV